MAAKGELIQTGSTRKIFVGDTGELDMKIGKRLSAFDVGTCPHDFAGIDAARLDFAEAFFGMLSANGILHNFLRRKGPNVISVTEFRRYILRNGIYQLQPPCAGLDNGRLLPLEFIGRFEVATQGFLDRLDDADDPLTLERLGLLPGTKLKVGGRIPFIVECSTKLEKPKDRYLSDKEAMEIGQLDEAQFSQCVRIVRQVGGLLLVQGGKNGIRLKDFKLELAITNDGQVVVADLLSPDELRNVDPGGVSRDKDIFRSWLGKVGFKATVEKERARAKAEGVEPIYPPYPDVPGNVSAAVSAGYREAVDMFWR